MTAQEKEQLHILYSTTQSYISELPLKIECPQFFDDTQTENTLEKIAENVSECTRCKLCKTRHYAVAGNGVKNPLVMVIGETPGEKEDLSSQPFVGPAGQLLDKMLIAIQLSKKTNVFIGNVVKCRPPSNRNPENDETQACRVWLDEQIALLKPKAILALGKVASHNLLSISDTMSRMHGKFYHYKDIPVMPTYHPSALLRNENMKRPAWDDLKRFRAFLLEKAPGYTEDYFYEKPENIPHSAYKEDSPFSIDRRQNLKRGY